MPATCAALAFILAACGQDNESAGNRGQHTTTSISTVDLEPNPTNANAATGGSSTSTGAPRPTTGTDARSDTGSTSGGSGGSSNSAGPSPSTRPPVVNPPSTTSPAYTATCADGRKVTFGHYPSFDEFAAACGVDNPSVTLPPTTTAPPALRIVSVSASYSGGAWLGSGTGATACPATATISYIATYADGRSASGSIAIVAGQSVRAYPSPGSTIAFTYDIVAGGGCIRSLGY